MFITKLITRGLKRRDFDLALDRANAITGDNFAGKTEILDAVNLGLVGYSPALGNTPRATFGLCRGVRLEIELHFDTNDVLRREWWLEGDTVKSKHTIPPALKNCPTLAVMLNAEEYFALGATDRTRYVFANCPVEIVSRETMQTRVDGAAIGLKVPEGVVAVYDLSTIFEKIDEENRDRVASNTPPMTPQEEIAMLLELVRADYTNQEREEKTQQGTINGLTGQRADETKLSVPLATLEDQRVALNAEIAEIQSRREAVIGNFTKMKVDQVRRGQIASEISRLTGKGDRTAELAGLKDRLALLAQTIAGFENVTTQRVQAVLQDIANAQTQRTLAASKVTIATNQIGKHEAAIAGLDTLTACPYCGAAGEGWKELKRAEYLSAIKAEKKNRDDADIQVNRYGADVVASVEIKNSLAAESERQNGYIQSYNDTKDEIAKLEPALARVTALREEQDRLLPNDPALTAKAETIQTELNVKNDELRGLNGLITAAAAREGDLVRMAKAEKLRDEAKARKDLAKAAGTELKLIQSEMVAGAFRPLLAIANSIFAGVLPFEIEYRDGEIGARENGIWRGHKTMSGVERLLTYCAIQMALAARSPIRVALLDEMGRLHSKRIPGFTDAVLGAIADGNVDQVLIVDPERGPKYQGTGIGGDLLAFHVIAVE